jgi:hypothetical protein
VETAHSDRPRREKESDSTGVLERILTGGLGGEEGRLSVSSLVVGLGFVVEKKRKAGCSGAGV